MYTAYILVNGALVNGISDFILHMVGSETDVIMTFRDNFRRDEY